MGFLVLIILSVPTEWIFCRLLGLRGNRQLRLDLRWDNQNHTIYTFPETNSLLHLKMDGWNISFLLGWPIFRGYVSFSSNFFLGATSKMHNLQFMSQSNFSQQKYICHFWRWQIVPPNLFQGLIVLFVWKNPGKVCCTTLNQRLSFTNHLPRANPARPDYGPWGGGLGLSGTGADFVEIVTHLFSWLKKYALKNGMLNWNATLFL